MGDAVKKPGQHRVEVVADPPNAGSRKGDDLVFAIDGHGVVGVVGLDERAGAAHSDRVEHIEEVFGGQVVGVDGHGPREVVPHRGDADIGEGGVVAQEVAELVVEVPQAVVDWGGGQQHELFGG